jgi:ribokinase
MSIHTVQGAKGALVALHDGPVVRVAGAAVEGAVVDTTGAGDAFVGSLAFFLARRPAMPVEEAVRRSCSLASLTVTRAGTQASYPARTEAAPWTGP